MIIRFNLQPWRDQRRADKQKIFVYTTVGVVVALGAALGGHYYIEQKFLESQKSAKSYLQQQVDSLKIAQKEVEETQSLIEKINEQIEAIEILQAQRGVALKLMDHLAMKTPESVFLNEVHFDGDQLIINGVAENQSNIADFMRALEQSELLGVSVLRGIKSAESTDRFTIPDNNTEVKVFTVAVELRPTYKDI